MPETQNLPIWPFDLFEKYHFVFISLRYFEEENKQSTWLNCIKALQSQLHNYKAQGLV